MAMALIEDTGNGKDVHVIQIQLWTATGHTHTVELPPN
ncbi:uncharacterized protein G2W53_009126 [Senna tora]|uniref:Uncharacterized protein n=1 Tax=Senna tora TaxID=362788 RepID=A0A834WXZ6_9FABA|nr:uncharacterized protein G2W53_009126 [Senna tora]